MSQYMQIDIRIIPLYEKPFAGRFPNIADLLKRAACYEPLEREISLYVLVDYLGAVKRDPSISSDMKQRIAPLVTRMEILKAEARECLLSRRLNDLDRLLYEMEDLFEDLEGSL